MKETCEFRIPEDRANVLFGPNEGQKLGGTVRRIVLSTDDPRYLDVGRINASFIQHSGGKRSFFNGWMISRQYTEAELKAARLLKCRQARTFEPAGEECGTNYDEAVACPICRAGARQATPLYLRLGSIPRSVDICRTIAGEIVVSRRFVELCKDNGFSGAVFSPVLFKNSTAQKDVIWFQLVGEAADAEISSDTRTGIEPFDLDEKNEYRCPCGHLIGLNILSEIYIAARSEPAADISFTRQFVGIRSGLLRPERVMLVRPRIRDLIVAEKLKGFEFEVARLA